MSAGIIGLIGTQLKTQTRVARRQQVVVDIHPFFPDMTPDASFGPGYQILGIHKSQFAFFAI